MAVVVHLPDGKKKTWDVTRAGFSVNDGWLVVTETKTVQGEKKVRRVAAYGAGPGVWAEIT